MCCCTTILAVNSLIQFFIILSIRSRLLHNLHSFSSPPLYNSSPFSHSDFFPFSFLLFVVFVHEINLFFINKRTTEQRTLTNNSHKFQAIQFGIRIVCMLCVYQANYAPRPTSTTTAFIPRIRSPVVRRTRRPSERAREFSLARLEPFNSPIHFIYSQSSSSLALLSFWTALAPRASFEK